MNRRSFLSLLGISAGGILLDQAILNGRVWSFPKEIKRIRPELSDRQLSQYIALTYWDFQRRQADDFDSMLRLLQQNQNLG